MNICMVTNSRNGSIFSNNIIKANAQLGNNTDIFEIDYDKSVQEEQNRLLAVIKHKKIDIVLFLNDFRFPDQSFFLNETIAQQADCRLWVWDAMHDMNDLKNHIYLYSKIYSFEINDILQLKEYYSIEGVYLPLFAGPEFYVSPRTSEDKQDLDIFFIGTIAGIQKRLDILEAAAKLAYEKNYKMLVLGRIWHDHHWHQRIIGKWKFKRRYPYLFKYVENKVLAPRDVIEYYKRTKINLNIHIEGHTCYNCRTFEVMANNNFLLSDRQNICDLKLEEGHHFECYANTRELVDKIQYYMNHDDERNQIANEGGQLIRTDYNLVNALKMIFS